MNNQVRRSIHPCHWLIFILSFWHSVFADGSSTPVAGSASKRLAVINPYSTVAPVATQRLFLRRLERDAMSLMPGTALSKNGSPNTYQYQHPTVSGLHWGLTHSTALRLQLQRSDTTDMRNEYNEISINAAPVKSTVTVLSMGLNFSF